MLNECLAALNSRTRLVYLTCLRLGIDLEKADRGDGSDLRLLASDIGRALSQLAGVLPQQLAPDASPREDLLAGLRGYLEAVAADPVTWRLVLMPPEGAPAVLRERIEAGRDAVVLALAEVVRPGLGPGTESPDPQLTARTLSAVSDDAARLLLRDPDEYPIERLVAHADWLLSRLEP